MFSFYNALRCQIQLLGVFHGCKVRIGKLKDILMVTTLIVSKSLKVCFIDSDFGILSLVVRKLKSMSLCKFVFELLNSQNVVSKRDKCLLADNSEHHSWKVGNIADVQVTCLLHAKLFLQVFIVI